MLINVKNVIQKKIIYTFAKINRIVMKRQTSTLLSLVALFLIVVLFASCGGRKLPKHYFMVGDNVYEIKSGIIINNGEVESGGFDLSLRLYTESGSDFINFNILSPQAEKLPLMTFNELEGSWVTGYTSNESYTNMATINIGSLIIDRSGEGYIIEIECTDQYNNKVEGYYKGRLDLKDENNLVHVVPEYVIPDEIYDAVTDLLPLYSGVTPPDMSGEYVSSPHMLIYESWSDNPDSIQYFSDRYMGFVYDSKQMNFYGKQYNVEQNTYEEEIQYGVKITGDNDYFTCYYVVDGYPGGYYAQQSFIFSGKKTDAGLEDFHTAVVLLETSGNPDLQPKHSYRVLKDEDGLAENNNWMSKGRSEKRKLFSDEDLFKMWMK